MGYGSRSYADASGKGEATKPDGSSNWTKFDHATAIAAALAHLALRQGDRVGMGVFAESMMTMLSRTSAGDQWRRIVGTLSTHTVDKPANLGRVIDQTIAKLNNRCLIGIISDFYEDPQEIRTAAEVRLSSSIISFPVSVPFVGHG